ncbi:YbaN family protein [Pseudogemmobacter bohemicus]|uniref:YbaN family protein n=1 Tax=Pseudogemmobacter bohemicus TaxID=2250708 RepID=UPI000DD4D26A|nr:YbaN family protein [Pseudogemmobacter bohemicus]
MSADRQPEDITPRGPVSRAATTKAAAYRALFMALGLFFTGLGFVGALLPVLPTVPFLILAAACFTRSSERLERWLMDHPRFGPLLRDWRDKGAIPRRAKWMAAAGCTVGFLLFLWGSHPGWPLILVVAAIMVFGVFFVFTRPDA